MIGIGEKDTPFEVDYISKKILSLKLFPAVESEPWGWNKSVVDGGFDILCGEHKVPFVLRIFSIPLAFRAYSA